VSDEYTRDRLANELLRLSEYDLSEEYKPEGHHWALRAFSGYNGITLLGLTEGPKPNKGLSFDRTPMLF
jgi:hypothetical protein